MSEEPKRRGRPPKSHLQNEHHFHAQEDFEQPSAPPAADASPEPAAEAEAGFAQPSAPVQEATALQPAEQFEGVEASPFADAPRSVDTAGLESLQFPLTENVADVVGVVFPEESPIEQKIHELVGSVLIPEASPAPENLNGWFVLPEEEAPHVEKLPPRNGTPVRVSETIVGDGIVVLWKKTRAFSNPTKRWTETGVWADFQTGVPISFKPKYWRGRYA